MVMGTSQIQLSYALLVKSCRPTYDFQIPQKLRYFRNITGGTCRFLGLHSFGARLEDAVLEVSWGFVCFLLCHDHWFIWLIQEKAYVSFIQFHSAAPCMRAQVYASGDKAALTPDVGGTGTLRTMTNEIISKFT